MYVYVIIVTDNAVHVSISGQNSTLVNTTVKFEVTPDPLVFS